MVIIFSLLVFVAFHYRTNKYSFETLNIVNDCVFIDTDSDIENLISVLLLPSLPEKRSPSVHRALWAIVIQLFTILNIKINNHDEK